MTTLKDRLRLALKESKVKQADLARACGVTTGASAQWFSGQTKTLKSDTAIRAAAFLGVNILWLAEGTGPMRPGAAPLPSEVPRLPRATDPAIAEVVKLMEATDDAGRKMALGGVRAALAGHVPQAAQAKRGR